MRLVLCFSIALSLACGTDQPAPTADPPEAPSENDSRFTVDGLGEWVLIDNAITRGGDAVEIRVRAPSGVAFVDAWVPQRPGVRLESVDGEFVGTLDLSHLDPGEHRVILGADAATTGFAAIDFKRSHPLYVVVTTDWDDADNPGISYTLQEQLHADHPELLITHFPGPYTFTDPAVTPARRAEIAAWLNAMVADHDDEIGLHIHPYCNFVEAAGLTCLSEPSTVYFGGDTTGYTVMVAAYSKDEFATQLRKADELFAENGLPKPTSFRAGGWTTDTHTLEALHEVGYVADTSALNWARMEEWEGVQNGVLYNWNMTQWSSINDTSQPYYPGTDDIQVGSDTPIGILQVPDNGIMVDYVDGFEMIEILQANWDGGVLTAPTQLSVGYHPPNFDARYHGRLDVLLSHADQFLASAGNGPIVYARLSDLAQVWTP